MQRIGNLKERLIEHLNWVPSVQISYNVERETETKASGLGLNWADGNCGELRRFLAEIVRLDSSHSTCHQLLVAQAASKHYWLYVLCCITDTSCHHFTMVATNGSSFTVHFHLLERFEVSSRSWLYSHGIDFHFLLSCLSARNPRIIWG